MNTDSLQRNASRSALLMGMHQHNLKQRAPTASVGTAPKPTLTPEEQVKLISSRTIDESTIFKPADIDRPASIVELARALQNNPDLIFQWVYNNVEYVPTFGEAKGGLGCLIDGYGNAFDQCELLFALLTQAGFTPNYVLGQIQMTAAQAAAWLGTDPTNINYAFNILNNGGIPVSLINNNTQVKLTHIWIQVAISGTTYVFDPSIKTYTSEAGINIGTATGYSQATLLAQAETGATVDPNGLFIQNVNTTDLTAQLKTYATNLQNYIKTNLPTATLTDVVGGRTIVPNTAPVRLTSQPYEVPGDMPTIWTAIPNSYRITVNIKVSTFNQTLYGSDVHGQRLTIWEPDFLGADVAPITLNGTQLGTFAPSSPWDILTYTITYPYATTFANATVQEVINSGSLIQGSPDNTYRYLLSFCFGPVGQGRVDYWQEQLRINQAANTDVKSEPNLGSVLALLWNTRAAALSAVQDVLGRMSQCKNIFHHQIGTTYWYGNTLGSSTSAAYAFNLNAVTILTEPLNANGNATACVLALGIHDGCTERASLQGVVQDTGSASPASFITAANKTATKLYKVTPANQSTTLPLLSGYSSDATTAYTNQLNTGYSLLIPQKAPENIGEITGTGWIPFTASGIFGYIVDTSINKGALSQNVNPITAPKKKKDPCDCEKKDPVDDRTGDYRYESSDITVGSSSFPYALEFKSMYDSRLHLNNSVLGLGWSHNWIYTASLVSEPLRALGSQSGIEAALSITEFFVSLDLNSDASQPVTKLAVLLLSGDWWAGQLCNNAYSLSFPDGDYTYVLLPDGTYNPQQNDNGILTAPLGGTVTHTTPQQEQKIFADGVSNTSGQWLMSSWTFPNGVQITINYSNTNPIEVGSVSNNTGRTLTFGYTGNFLSSVTDGNSRTVNYSVNTTTNLLTSISDPLSNVTTFGYDSANRMYQYFRPQNPTTAYVTNSYDSLNRISQQLDQYGNKWQFYFAGSRSQFVDPAGNSEVEYYDSNNNLIEEIDELGNITTYARDGRGRVSLRTYPEGNSEVYTYDSVNNVLSVTYQAKAGSGLANIVNSYTYDPTYNKVHTAVDGKSQTTTYNYDPATGNLLTVKKPAVSGVTPTITYAYNTRGQVWSTIDETGIQTQNNYDTTTEELLSTVVNTNWRATIGGTVTVGDVLTLTAHDTLLSGGQESVSYTVKTGDTTTTIAAGLAAAVNADANLSAVGIVAYVNGTALSLSTATGNTTTFTESVSTGATETIALAAGLKLSTTFGYDAVGNVNSVKDPRLNKTTFLFDNARRLTQRTETTPFSYVTMYGYDKNNNLTSVQRQTGITQTPWQTYTIAYTVSDKVYTVTDPAMHVTTKTYDTFDRLWTVTDAQSRKTTFAYDARSKLHTVTDPSNTISETRTYTNNGKLYQLTDARSNTTTYSYDGFDRLNKTTYADTSYEQNSSYDANNNVLTQRTRSAATITLTYDPLNRLSTKTPTGQAKVTFSYDLSGRLTQASTPVVSGNPATGAFKFSYDTAGRLTQETTPDALTVKYGLDANGNVTKLTYPDSYYVTRVYDQLNRLTDIKLNGATTSAIHITYDELSRRNVLTYGNGATSTYTFQLNDDLTGLAEAFTGSSVVFAYGFNNVHQENSRSVSDGTYLWHPGAGGTTTYGTANSVNEYPTVGGSSYSYDGNGNLKSDGTWTYTYDTENHLLSATKTGVSASYVYDGLHRQVQKTVGSVETRFYYAGWQRLADYDGVAKTLQTRYVYGTSLDEGLLTVSSAGSITYLHADRMGSIVAATDSTGAVVGKTGYGPYGEGAPPVISIGLTGQRYDAETGLYYYKRRYYSVSLGRFLQIDPSLGDDFYSYNLYRYVENDPLNKTDQLGNVSAIAEGIYIWILLLLLLFGFLDALKKAKCTCKVPPEWDPTTWFPTSGNTGDTPTVPSPGGVLNSNREKAHERWKERLEQGLKKGEPLIKKGNRGRTHSIKDKETLDLGGGDSIEYDNDGNIVSINGKAVDN